MPKRNGCAQRTWTWLHLLPPCTVAKPNKAPAFQWYAADYLSDAHVQVMTLEQQGAYVRLMSYCWLERGKLPSDPGKLAALVQCSPKSFSRLWPAVRVCFTLTDDGTAYEHPRLTKEREKQAVYALTQGEHGTKGGRPRKGSLSEPFSESKGLKSSSSPSPSSISTTTATEVERGEVNTDTGEPDARGEVVPRGELDRGAHVEACIPASPSDLDAWLAPSRKVLAEARRPTGLVGDTIPVAEAIRARGVSATEVARRARNMLDSAPDLTSAGIRFLVTEWDRWERNEAEAAERWAFYVRHRLDDHMTDFRAVMADLVKAGHWPSVETAEAELQRVRPWEIARTTRDDRRKAVAKVSERLPSVSAA